ncbi:MAG: hypothetical protein FWC41_11700 [Firmicutes bacterium]|nr:hypothetical protein [Bacillota bacterium]
MKRNNFKIFCFAISVFMMFSVVASTASAVENMGIEVSENKHAHDEGCNRINSDSLPSERTYSYDELTKNKKIIEFDGVTIVTNEYLTVHEFFDMIGDLAEMINDNNIQEQTRGNCGHNNYKCITDTVTGLYTNATYCSYYTAHKAWKCQTAGCNSLITQTFEQNTVLHDFLDMGIYGKRCMKCMYFVY